MARVQQLSDIDRLRLQAEDFWEHQQDGLAKAKALAAEARRQGLDYTRDEVAPRARAAVGSGVAAVGSALATIQAFRDKQVRDALTTVSRVKLQSPVVIAPASQRKSGVGIWIGLGIGVIAAAAVGYVVWQTLRADDELWIEDEATELPAE